MTQSDPLDLDALARLERRATDGPWRVVLDDSENATTVWRVCTSPDHPAEDDPDRIGVYDCCASGGLHSEPWYTEADAEFVAALRNAAEGLIRRAREAERLRRELADWMRAMDEARADAARKVEAELLAATSAGPVAPVEPERCPTCDSHAPHLHPAMQFEGEVQICPDPWHHSGGDPR